MKVYNFLSEENALNDLFNQYIKVSTLNDLNDPFELLSIDFSEKSLRPKFKQLKDSLSKKLAIICFTKSWRNPLLWSHYADRHRGCALEFDISQSELVQIEYRKSRVKIPNNIPLNDFLTQFELKLVSTKYSGWKYENEYRLFLDKNELTKVDRYLFYNFDSGFFPSAIIAGPLSKLDQNTIEKNLPFGKSINFIKSRLAFKSFEVVKNKSLKTSMVKGNAQYQKKLS